MNMTELKPAVDVLVKNLNEDPSYRYGWQANIAVQFQDEWQRAVDTSGLPATPKDIHKISNNAAKAFLNLLCGTREAVDEKD